MTSRRLIVSKHESISPKKRMHLLSFAPVASLYLPVALAKFPSRVFGMVAEVSSPSNVRVPPSISVSGEGVLQLSDLSVNGKSKKRQSTDSQSQHRLLRQTKQKNINRSRGTNVETTSRIYKHEFIGQKSQIYMSRKPLFGTGIFIGAFCREFTMPYSVTPRTAAEDVVKPNQKSLTSVSAGDSQLQETLTSLKKEKVIESGKKSSELFDSIEAWFRQQSRMPPTMATSFSPKLTPLWAGQKLFN